ncbi:MAG: fused MFS/spermidine synthase [Gammaproteobacteria bacterium]|nr:fused MFS/spermidine synthase [Gammaproteobacteria bacterium]
MRKLTDRGVQIYAAHDEEGRLEIFDRDGVRSLYFDSGACQSSLRLNAPTTLVLAYTRSMLAALLFRPEPRRILLIGLGGGALARFLLQHRPAAQLHCVETRSSVVTLAHDFFHLPSAPHLHMHINDGAAFLRRCGDQEFDMILVDAFDGGGIHPNVCAPEFHTDCRRVLTEGGVLSVNLWNTPEAPCKPLLDAIEQGFGGQILQLPVEERANLIALGLDKPRTQQDLKLLRESAQQLTETLGLDFTKQLRSLRHRNSAVLRRGITPRPDSLSRTIRR